MPSRNILKSFAADNYYHIYNRGVAKQVIYHDEEDYTVFLSLLKRYLDIEPHKNRRGAVYEHMRDEVELLAYCLMPNHFHLLFYLKEEQAITRLMRAVCTTYTAYYNKKYSRVGTLFQGRYKASPITSDEYLQHISRYIHLNPKDYLEWPYSSLGAYMGRQQIDWLIPGKIQGLFDGGPTEYRTFLKDYEGHKAALEEIKHELADK